MRHRVDKRKLNRTTPHRKSMFANMVSSLVKHNRIETTLPKAKELKRIADRMVTIGKQQTLHARRRAISLMRDKEAVSILFNDIAKRFETRNGGYTRIYKLGFRHGDKAEMAAIEYLGKEVAVSSQPAKKPAAKKAKPARKVEKKKVTKKTTKKSAAPKKAKMNKKTTAKKKAVNKTKKASKSR